VPKDNLDQVDLKGFGTALPQIASSEQASAMQTDGERAGSKPTFTESSTPEAELYGYLLVLTYAIDKKQFRLVGGGSSHSRAKWVSWPCNRSDAALALVPCRQRTCPSKLSSVWLTSIVAHWM
jgi:hypothetical protein